MATTSAPIRARHPGFLADVATVALRAIRLTLRDPEAIVPALVIPVFFFVINLGQLQSFTERGFPQLDFKAFQLPVAIIFAVTGVSRAGSLVIDIQSGYLDRLLVTPLRRVTLLLGLMIADLALVTTLSLGVVAMGFAVGVRFETGVVGVLLFVLMGGLWGLAFTGFPYAIALKTGSPAAVNSSFLLFFPFAFLTSSYVPADALTGWLREVSRFNPCTYLLEGMRSLVYGGWDGAALGKGALAIAGVGTLSISLAMAALRGRVNRA